MNKRPIALAILLALAACGDANQTANNSSGNAGAAAEAPQPAGGRTFVNNPNNNFSASMKEKYVDFSFTYPEGWRERIAPDAGNFVQVYAPEVNGLEPFSFALGHASGSGIAAADKQLMATLLPQFEQQFGSSIQDFEVTGRGERQLGSYATQGFDFTGKAPGPGGQPVELSGRLDIILPPGQQRGVTAISLAYDRGNGAPAPAAIAQQEPMRLIYDSLKVGNDSR